MKPDNFSRQTRLRWRRLATGAVLVVTVGGAALVVTRMTLARVTLDIEGQVWRYQTRAETVADLLDEADIDVAPEDVVSPGLSTRIEDGMTVTVQKAHPVTVVVDGTMQQVYTHAQHPLDILAGQGITLYPYDVVTIDGLPVSREALMNHTWLTPPQTIRVLRSVTVTIIDDATPLTLHTTAPDVQRALDETDLELYLADRITPDLTTPLEDGMTIHIERSIPITVIADGRQLATRARGATVGDALAVIGLAPIGQDYTIPSLDAALVPNMTIRLVRVTIKPSLLNQEYSLTATPERDRMMPQ